MINETNSSMALSLYENGLYEKISRLTWNGREIQQLNGTSYGAFSIRLCKEKANDLDKEAQGHFDNAREALGEALMHSAGAGLSIEVPPVALYEAYKAVQAWKEMASEYNKGCEIEDNINKKKDD